MELRTKFLNQIILDNEYKSYLEIGIDNCENYNAILTETKVSVDPSDLRGCKPMFMLTSDDFFSINKSKFDLIFIDGMHTFEVSFRDLLNSLNILNENGTIVLHDTFPRKYEHQTVPATDPCWTGDVWKTILKAQLEIKNISIRTYDVESGITIIKKSSNENLNNELKPIYYYEYFTQNYKNILNIQTFPYEF